MFALTAVVSFILITQVSTVIITITDPHHGDAPVIVTLEIITGACCLIKLWKKKKKKHSW